MGIAMVIIGVDDNTHIFRKYADIRICSINDESVIGAQLFHSMFPGKYQIEYNIIPGESASMILIFDNEKEEIAWVLKWL